MIRSPSMFLAAAFAIILLACPAFGQSTVELRGNKPPADGIWVDSLDLSKLQQEWGEVHAGRSVDNRPMTLGGIVYRHGIGTHAASDVLINLKGSALRFEAVVGVDDEKRGQGSVRFHVIVDGKPVVSTPILHGGDKPQPISVDLSGAKRLRLSVDDGDDGIDSDHADWAGALLVLKPEAGEKPQTVEPPKPPAPILSGPHEAKPEIHNPRIVGSTPGRPFLFLIPATGDGPLSFSAKNLPTGLSLDEHTGIITGSLQAAGKTAVHLTVKGSAGSTSSVLTIVGGEHQLALTPPMGWNSWNVWAGRVDAAKIRAAADSIVSSGLAAHGFQYVNIDDTWESKRDAKGEIHGNEKFGDMKALADYVHSKGLKLGIYSSPGPRTCAGFPGSFDHEEQDAKAYGRWGIDYLKYDWCSCQSKDPAPPTR